MTDHPRNNSQAADRTRSGERLRNASMLISLDVLLPFHPLLGLPNLGGTKLRDGMREVIRGTRQLKPDAVPDSFAGAWRPLAEAHLGRSAAAALATWVERVYSQGPREHLPLRHWVLVLREGRRDEAKWASLIPDPALAANALRRFNNATDMGAFDALESRAASHPLSDWDLHLYALNSWDDDDPGAPNGPFSYAKPIAKDVAAYRFFNWLLPRLSQERRQQFSLGGQAIVRSTESLRYIKTLADPATLVLEEVGE